MTEGMPGPEPDPAGLPARREEAEDDIQARADDRYARIAEQMKFIREVDYTPKPIDPVPVKSEYRNVDQTRIEVTEDKLRHAISSQIARRDVRMRWVSAASLFVVFVAALVTTDFRDYVLPASTWQGVFGACALLSGVLVIRYGWAALNAPTREELVEDMIREIAGERSPRVRRMRWRRPG